MVPDWIWLTFIFAFGCSIGSFLNVVIYRLPRDKSLLKPPSSCPNCQNRIPFYDNIPLVSWLFLGRKCRFCKAPISPRYFVIELLTAAVFIGVFILFFRSSLRAGIGPFAAGGWFIYIIYITMLAGFIAASAIDLELWVIPLCICWFVTAVGVVGSGLAAYIIEPGLIRGYHLLPSASPATGALAAGASIGLVISLVLLTTGLIKGSYASGEQNQSNEEQSSSEEPVFRHRLEVCREILFLLPIIVCSLAGIYVVREFAPIERWWLDFSQKPAVAGVLGSLWGYFVGCSVVWVTRILGTLAFGKEAMGLGDVHLMGAAGAVTGPGFVTVAFFIAPFFGLGWAGMQMFFKKTRQIPYGPFLSMGVIAVMILHDWLLNYWNFIRYHY